MEVGGSGRVSRRTSPQPCSDGPVAVSFLPRYFHIPWNTTYTYLEKEQLTKLGNTLVATDNEKYSFSTDSCDCKRRQKPLADKALPELKRLLLWTHYICIFRTRVFTMVNRPIALVTQTPDA